MDNVLVSSEKPEFVKVWYSRECGVCCMKDIPDTVDLRIKRPIGEVDDSDGDPVVYCPNNNDTIYDAILALKKYFHIRKEDNCAGYLEYFLNSRREEVCSKLIEDGREPIKMAAIYYTDQGCCVEPVMANIEYVTKFSWQNHPNELGVRYRFDREIRNCQYLVKDGDMSYLTGNTDEFDNLCGLEFILGMTYFCKAEEREIENIHHKIIREITEERDRRVRYWDEALKNASRPITWIGEECGNDDERAGSFCSREPGIRAQRT